MRQRMRQANWPLPNLSEEELLDLVLYEMFAPGPSEEDDREGGKVGD